MDGEDIDSIESLMAATNRTSTGQQIKEQDRPQSPGKPP